VTPPDMLLPEFGPIISVLSSDSNFLHDVELMYENLFKTVPITLCHTDGNIVDENCAWTVSMMRFSDTVYVDLDNITELGIACVLTQESDNFVIISNTNKRKGMRKLLNTMRKYNIYESVEDYSDIMLDSLETV
jgi:hypothetical protein